jgi:hypothetical protein
VVAEGVLAHLAANIRAREERCAMFVETVPRGDRKTGERQETIAEDRVDRTAAEDRARARALTRETEERDRPDGGVGPMEALAEEARD